jgi:hypothetical protein
MAFMNINYQLLIAEDSSSKNPNIRLPDITNNIDQIPVSQDRSDRIILYPSETKTLSTTARVLPWDNTTSLSFVRPYESDDTMRLQWLGTGTNPAFRTLRSIGGGATTEVSVTIITPYVKRIQNVAGTAWSLASVQVGDYIKFEKTTQTFASPFSETNQGQTYLVQSKGADFIDFVDNSQASIESAVVLGADFAFALRVFTPGAVRIGDTVAINGLANQSNHGKFEVVGVSPDYIEFVSPLGVTETLTYTSNNFVIYDYLIGFVHLRAFDSILLRFGAQTEWLTLSKMKNQQAIFFGSANTYQIEAKNDGSFPVEISIQTAKLD